MSLTGIQRTGLTALFIHYAGIDGQVHVPMAVGVFDHGDGSGNILDAKCLEASVFIDHKPCCSLGLKILLEKIHSHFNKMGLVFIGADDNTFKYRAAA